MYSEAGAKWGEGKERSERLCFPVRHSAAGALLGGAFVDTLSAASSLKDTNAPSGRSGRFDSSSSSSSTDGDGRSNDGGFIKRNRASSRASDSSHGAAAAAAAAAAADDDVKSTGNDGDDENENENENENERGRTSNSNREGGVNGVAWVQGGAHFVSAGDDGVVRVWSSADGGGPVYYSHTHQS